MQPTWVLFCGTLWQYTLFAAAAGVLTLAFRGNRTAVCHSLWLAASLKSLALFSPLVAVRYTT